MIKLRVRKLTILALVIGMIGAGVFRSIAKDVDAAKKADAKPKVEFPPEVETKFAEFLTKASEAKRKQWTDQMKKEIGEIAKVTNIDAAGVEKLTSIANEAANLCREGWAKKVDQFWRRNAKSWRNEIAQAIDQLSSQLGQYVQNDYFGDYVRPHEHPAWIEGLARVLSAEQLAAWKKAQATSREAATKEIGDFLKPIMTQNREMYIRQRMAQGSEIKQTLALSKERADQLDRLANTIADEIVESWRKLAERNLLLVEDTARRKIFKNRHYYTAPEVEDAERHEAAWKDGIAKLLSAEESQRLEKTRGDRKARRIQACALFLIAEFDKKIAFTVSQRERLRAPMEKLAPSINAFFPEENMHYGLSLNELFTAGAQVKEEEIKEILDPVQLQHWHEVCAPQSAAGSNSRSVSARRNKPTAAENESPENLEPEKVEHIISDFFVDKTTGERKRGLLAMIVKAEDAARIAMLNPDSLDRLQTAARGAAGQSLATWRGNLEMNIRGNLKDADAENIQARLASIPEYQLERGINLDAGTTILDEALKAELSDAQRAAWKKELDARTDYRAKALGAYLLTQFDRWHLLTADQLDKLAPKLEQILKEYDEDFAQMFSYYAGGWYLQSYSQFMPFAGIPEKELKDILSKEQWESWSGSNEFSNATNYWENVKRRHDQRMKEAKK